MVLSRSVFDALAESENDFRAGVTDGLKVSVRSLEPIAARVFRIFRQVRKNNMDINDVRVRPMAVVKASEGNGSLPMVRRQVHQPAVVQRTRVASMQGAKLGTAPGEIYEYLLAYDFTIRASTIDAWRVRGKRKRWIKEGSERGEEPASGWSKSSFWTLQKTGPRNVTTNAIGGREGSATRRVFEAGRCARLKAAHRGRKYQDYGPGKAEP